ncbi:hypothetical protein PIB30_025365 [Stylosanthes scabra]|uniref:Uncharacterized protein n=1 Tax=Stylosanthes scabra TaxID=79078 RepID=A0ABU6Y8K3_9FABA|nr:hypothetical protein [Stylosanthes scabra]
MALFLGLLRYTSFPATSSCLWLVRFHSVALSRCQGLVLSIVGRSTFAWSLATRSLEFKISVLYFDLHPGSVSSSIMMWHREIIKAIDKEKSIRGDDEIKLGD